MILHHRPRRLRRSETIRAMATETRVHVDQLVDPIFIIEGKNQKQAIESLPGKYRFSIDLAVKEIEKGLKMGVRSVALFPVIDPSLKSDNGDHALDPDNLALKAIQEIKKRFPEVTVISDVALDPYTTHGHDGIVQDGKVLNDETVQVLIEQACLQAEAGADFVAPSDMMDGRVGAIREILDEAGFQDTGIIAYTAKYASAFYGPFRDAVGAKLKGDKKTYQMNPANRREAVREAILDERQGADMLMVKPALAYLDIIAAFKKRFALPIAAYNVSGEYAMIKAAAKAGWLNEEQAIHETLTSIARAGADVIFTYHAHEFAAQIQKS